MPPEDASEFKKYFFGKRYALPPDAVGGNFAKVMLPDAVQEVIDLDPVQIKSLMWAPCRRVDWEFGGTFTLTFKMIFY